MNLIAMLNYLEGVVHDSRLSPGFPQMINDTILEIASDFELPALKLLTPVSFPVDGTTWLWKLPDNFHKKLFRVGSSSVTPWRRVRICDHIEDLTARNPAHDATGTNVTEVAWGEQGNDNFLGIYPLPLTADNLQLWYYRKPALVLKPADVPDCFPAEFHERVIMPKCVFKNFRFFTDYIEDGTMKSLAYWEGLYKQGLYGSPMGDIGLVNYLAKLRGGPRRHGGRDPIGPSWRGFYAGYI